MKEHLAYVISCVVSVVIVTVALTLCSGCGGAMHAAKAERGARTALHVAAEAVNEADAFGEKEVARADARCANEEDFAAWKACMRPIYALRDALVAARAWLLMAEEVVDATGAKGFVGIAGCVSEVLVDLDAALRVSGITLKASIQTALDGLKAWGHMCNVRHTAEEK